MVVVVIAAAFLALGAVQDARATGTSQPPKPLIFAAPQGWKAKPGCEGRDIVDLFLDRLDMMAPRPCVSPLSALHGLLPGT